MHSTRLMRARINDRLARATQYPVTLILAPAGFGKSVALRDFLLSARIDAVRFDVRREDESLLDFARRFCSALEPVAPSASAAFSALQERVMGSTQAPKDMCAWFAEHLRRVVCTIVVDDLHFAEPLAVEFLAQLVDRTSNHIDWILASRSDAGLPVASWLGYGRMDVPVDERDLRFTEEEALAAADEAQGIVAPDEVRSLLELTEGWPVALAIALRTRTGAADLRSAARGTREMVYRYLAEQVLGGVTREQRAFLLATSIFSSFDVEMAAALDGGADFIAELRRGVAFLSETRPGNYRYHDLFRDYLESELLRCGDAAFRDALRAGGSLLEERGERAEALRLYTKAGDAERIARILDADGFGLFERGHAETLLAALDVLPESLRAQSASALGLRAMLDAARGHFDVARHGFARAIDVATGDEQRFALLHRYALELVRHDLDCIDLLEPYANDRNVDGALRVPLLGTLATAYARVGRNADALAAVAATLDSIEASRDDVVRARVYQQVAYVYLQEQGSHEKARAYAELAIELAVGRNLFEVAVRAYSVLSTISYDEYDDPIASLTILDRLIEAAGKGAGSQARLFGLLASCWIEAERGNDSALERITHAIEAAPGNLERVQAEALQPAQALRAAWEGDFSRAYDLLEGSAERLGTDERKGYRASELAYYAFAAGRSIEGERALRIAAGMLARCRPTRRALCARLLLALAELVRGHAASAHRHLNEVQETLAPSMRRLRALAHAARTLYRVQLGQADPALLTAAIERLRAEHFGGFARLIEATPFPQGATGSYASLTATEREILHLLAAGASSKEVAAKTGRSPNTVDTHIRSVCRKLKCNGRRAAVALATGAGWVRA
ncbi:MAG: AAA family ATPase [Candidatus Eremiobacteraeota bacterium]|nr:AAA family ATPase [Candidatus Eremiobacteraeota bacterium]